MENARLHFRAGSCIGHALDGQIIAVLAGIPILLDYDGAHPTADGESVHTT